MTPPLSLDEAQAQLLEQAAPLGAEIVATADAQGRWLASSVTARRSSPAADLSAMDGFATAGTGPWGVVGESAAGHPWRGNLSPGQCVRISTGALVPPGADGILLTEDSRTDGGQVEAALGPPNPRYIRRTGFDFRAGDEVLPSGARIGAPQIALALAAGCQQLEVGRLPSVAIIDTGDELVSDGIGLADGMTPATNGAMLAAMCRSAARHVEAIGPLPDDRAALLSGFEQASGADVIVTSGGVSVGDHDLIRPALEEWGAAIEFWRVAIKPGKPLLVARRGRQWVLGLPGNPASSFVTAMLFLLPLLRRLGAAAVEHCTPRRIPASLAAPLPAGDPRREFLRGRWTPQGIVALPQRDSSAVRTLAAAELLIDRPANAPAAAAGETVPVILLENGRVA